MGFLLPVISRLILCHSPIKTPIVRALKNAGRYKAEGDSDGLAGCAVSRPCPPGVELAQGVTTRAATCREANGKPPVTERGASSKNAPKGIGYMLDAARYCGGQRTHGKGCSHGSAGDGYPMRAPIKCGSMIGSCGHLRAFLAGITKKSFGVTRPSVTFTISWIVE